MSEFKFACPVCGQHLTADSSNVGGEISCPTCFQRLAVPPAPAFQESKLILTAARAGEHKTSHEEAILSLRSRRRKVFTRWTTLAFFAVLVSAIAIVGRVYLEKYVGRRAQGGTLESAPVLEKKVHSFWTADLRNVVLPETSVSGKIRGDVLEDCEATLQGGTFSLVRNHDSRLQVVLFAQHPRELSGKAFAIPQSKPNPRPRIELSWPNEKAQAQTQTFDGGYVLKMSFGQLEDGKIPGEIYLSLPDNYRSFVAGRFVAEVIDPGRR